MNAIDVSANPRIPILLDMVRKLSAADDPRAALEVFVSAMRRAYQINAYVALNVQGLPPGHFRITRWLSNDNRELVTPADAGVVPPNLPIHSGGFLSTLLATPEPKLQTGLNVQTDPVVGDRLADYRSLIACPIFERGELLAWVVLLAIAADRFREDDLEDLIIRANMMGTTIDNILTNRRLREAGAWIEREVDQIAELQRTMLPSPIPRIPGLSIAASFKTFDRAGGDYYDLFPLSNGVERVPRAPDERWGLFIADASGHGPSAAFVVALLNGLLHAEPRAGQTPSTVLNYLNRHLLARNFVTSFVTAFYGIYDPVSRQFTYARAGHNPPAIKQPGVGGSVRWLDNVGGLPLGVVEDIHSVDGSLVLQPGQTLVLYTDGVVEELCPRNTMFTAERLARTLTECSGEPQALIDAVNRELIAHQAETRPDDDQTIVALRVEP